MLEVVKEFCQDFSYVFLIFYSKVVFFLMKIIKTPGLAVRILTRYFLDRSSYFFFKIFFFLCKEDASCNVPFCVNPVASGIISAPSMDV